MTFIENWFGVNSQNRLTDLAHTISDVEGLIIEVGCWEGRSTVALANAVHPRVVHAVDTWNGSPGEISAELAATRDVYSTFLSNVAELTAGNVKAHRMGWRDYLPTVQDPVAFAFIDAEHTYREVFDNVTALLPMLAHGAVLCGDDAHHEPIRRALFELLPVDDILTQATLWWWVNP